MSRDTAIRVIEELNIARCPSSTRRCARSRPSRGSRDSSAGRCSAATRPRLRRPTASTPSSRSSSPGSTSHRAFLRRRRDGLPVARREPRRRGAEHAAPRLSRRAAGAPRRRGRRRRMPGSTSASPSSATASPPRRGPSTTIPARPASNGKDPSEGIAEQLGTLGTERTGVARTRASLAATAASIEARRDPRRQGDAGRLADPRRAESRPENQQYELDRLLRTYGNAHEEVIAGAHQASPTPPRSSTRRSGATCNRCRAGSPSSTARTRTSPPTSPTPARRWRVARRPRRGAPASSGRSTRSRRRSSGWRRSGGR